MNHAIASYDPIPASTKEKALSNRIGSPAYQMVFASAQPKTLVSKAHFASLAKKTGEPKFKSMGHGGMFPTFGTKHAGL